MPKIDSMLKMMSDKGVEHAILTGDQPYQIFAAGKRVEGSITPRLQLHQLLEEVTPPPLVSELQSYGTFRFQYASPYGPFEIGVTHDLGVAKITLSPASAVDAAPQGAPMPAPYPAATPPPLTPYVPPPVYSTPAAPPFAPPTSPVSHTELVAAPDNAWGNNTLASPSPYVPPAHQVPPSPYAPPPHGAYPTGGQQPSVNVHVHQTNNNVGAGFAMGPPRSRIAAGLLAIFLGCLGIHRFYLGYSGVGAVFLVLTLVISVPTCFGSLYAACLWGFIEGIIILCGGMTDAYGRPLET